MKNNKSILVAMSGGIDSNTAAFLLKESGYQVTGIYFHLVNDDCCDYDFGKEISNKKYFYDSHIAREVADKLNIKLLEVDYKEAFSRIVIRDFVRKYKSGITPNPCVLCNEKIKFPLLIEHAANNGIKYIATGHYSRIEFNSALNKCVLKRGVDRKKDQSYFLYRLGHDTLPRTIFPLGELTKKNVENIASRAGLKSSKAKESQEICFISGNNYRKLIEDRVYQQEKKQTGYFVDTSGNVLGIHKGIAFYTIGQRRKIGLSLNSRKYIVEINAKENKIVIGDESDLYQKEFKLEELHYSSIAPITQPIELQVQIRYNTIPAKATIFPNKNNKLQVIFKEPKRAITPGQSAVFYDNDVVLGGGIITF